MTDQANNAQGILGDDTISDYAVDIVFALDSTQSMQGVIDEAKTAIREVVSGVVAGFKDNQKPLKKLRARVIEYRDMLQDKTRNMIEHPFLDLYDGTTDVTTTEAFESLLGGIKAEGGGDPEESTFDALCRAFDSEWTEEGTKQRKLVVVITDNDSKPLHESTRRESERDLSDADVVLQRMSNATKGSELALLLVAPFVPNYEKIRSAPRLQSYELKPGQGAKGIFTEEEFGKIITWVVKVSQLAS